MHFIKKKFLQKYTLIVGPIWSTLGSTVVRQKIWEPNRSISMYVVMVLLYLEWFSNQEHIICHRENTLGDNVFQRYFYNAPGIKSKPGHVFYMLLQLKYVYSSLF